MPKPKLSEEIVTMVIELLLGGWTPQQIAESGLVAVSLPSVQRIARAEGLARQKGAQPGRPRPVGAGRRKGQLGPKWSKHRDEAITLRASGQSLRAIAAELGLRSAEAIRYLTDEKA